MPERNQPSLCDVYLRGTAAGSMPLSLQNNKIPPEFRIFLNCSRLAEKVPCLAISGSAVYLRPLSVFNSPFVKTRLSFEQTPAATAVPRTPRIRAWVLFPFC